VPGTFTRSLRSSDWRYVWYADGFEELFVHRKDPHGYNNLALDEAHGRVLANLRRACFEQHLRLEDPRIPADDARLLAVFSEWKT
jgi:hypothetical protein